jgi:Secretion system C-terminal sorting domain
MATMVFFNQMSIILPKVGNQYYVFTSGMSDKAFDEWQSPNANFDSFRFDNLNYAIVDMDANNGAGKVLEKNKVLLQDMYLSHNRMSAVRHANGRDWWLVKPHKELDIFYSFLITDNEIKGPFISKFEDPKIVLGIVGQMCFNQSGTQFVQTQAGLGFAKVYNFDRCNGTIAKYKNFYIKQDSVKYGGDWTAGVAFSPNDSLLYVSTRYSISQVDLFTSNINNTIKITGPDTLLDYFPWYEAMALAPDNKIYIGNGNGNLPSMDYIEFPNIKGLGCSFRGRGNGAIQSPYSNLLVPPNMPNYGLGVLAGSPCDTIRAQINNWLLYPNPAREMVKLKVLNSSNGQSVTIQIFDMLGKLIVQSIRAINYEHEAIINTSNLANGLYILKANSEGKEFIGKFVKE